MVNYKRGKDNLVADALSRCNLTVEQCLDLHVLIPEWKKDLRDSLKGDQVAQELLVSLAINSKNEQGYELIDGELKKDGKLYVGAGNKLREQIISNLHGSSEGGHSGILPTTKRIEDKFYWPTLKQEVQSYVKSCDTCQKCKPEHIPYPGLLHPLPIRPQM